MKHSVSHYAASKVLQL